MFNDNYAIGTPLIRNGKRYSGKFPIRHWYKGWNSKLACHEVDYIFYDGGKWRQDTKYEKEVPMCSFYRKARSA